MLDAVEASANHTLATIDAIVECRQELKNQLITQSRPADENFLDLLIEQPYCRISSVQERCDKSRPAAANWLRSLVEVGTLKEEKVGKAVIFSNHSLMAALTRATT